MFKFSYLTRLSTAVAVSLGAVTLIGALSTTAHAQDAAAEPESPFSVDLAAALASDYMFRGQNLYDGISIQPSATASYDTGAGTLSAGLWMHLSAEGDRQAEKFTELDATIAYEIPLDPVTLKVGHLWYTYPNDDDEIADTAEFFGAVSLDDSEMLPFALSPTLAYYYDYREIEYHIFELGMSHKFECEGLGKGFNTTPYVTFGFVSDGEVLYEDDGLAYVNLGTSFEMELGNISVVPSVNYTFEVDDNTVNEFWILTTFGYTL